MRSKVQLKSNPGLVSSAVEPFARRGLGEKDRSMSYFVYILRTSKNTLYIGQTNNLERRLKEHKEGKSKSAKYVRYFSSFDLVYSQIYNSRVKAIQREAELKNWPKAKKEALIMDGKLSSKVTAAMKPMAQFFARPKARRRLFLSHLQGVALGKHQ